MDPKLSVALQFLAYFYAASIVLGRLYCGMHGFFDVFWGSALGALLGAMQGIYGRPFDGWLHGGDFKQVFVVVLLTLVLVRVHPEPADDCPCFDDSVSFAGVFFGCEFGVWAFAHTAYSLSTPALGTTPFDLAKLGWLVTVARIVLGVGIILVWKGGIKPALLKILPPVFRVIETLGLTLPRRFFKPASEYETVPRQSNDDNIIPAARAIPGLLSNFRRRRAISIGPQSEADAYETLAYRNKRRRDSMNATDVQEVSPAPSPDRAYFTKEDATSGRKRSSSLKMFREQMGTTGSSDLSPMTVQSPHAENVHETDVQEERRIFANIQKPRVRYDVEVVTRLIVYSGIGWWAVHGIPVVFHHVGLSIY
jgi:dihydrosphingosine 1-phosphate phosphatase